MYKNTIICLYVLTVYTCKRKHLNNNNYLENKQQL